MEGPDEAPLGLSEEEQGQEGWPVAAAGWVEEEWEEEECPADLWKVAVEVEGEGGEVEEEGC